MAFWTEATYFGNLAVFVKSPTSGSRLARLTPADSHSPRHSEMTPLVPSAMPVGSRMPARSRPNWNKSSSTLLVSLTASPLPRA